MSDKTPKPCDCRQVRIEHPSGHARCVQCGELVPCWVCKVTREGEAMVDGIKRENDAATETQKRSLAEAGL